VVREKVDLREGAPIVASPDEGRDTFEPLLGQRPSADEQYEPRPQPKTSQYGGNLTLIGAGAERLAIARCVPYAPPLTMGRAIILLLAGLSVAGCKQHIGDSCGSSTDCSVTGERQCDLAQPGGYCTVFSCDPDTCPEGACVEWRFIPSRTAETWCMKTCNDTGNCRFDYACVLPSQITMSGDYDPNLPADERVARIIDLDADTADDKICVALSPDSPQPDALTQAELDGGL